MTGRCRQILILVSWMFLLISQAQAAEQPVLVFPQVAADPSIRIEINLANLGNRAASGYIWFRHQADGSDMQLMVEGNLKAKVSFSLPPGGARKLVASSDSLQVGYATVMANSTSTIVGNLIFTVKFKDDVYDLSVPHSPPTTRAHLVIDRSTSADSAVAFLNTGAERATLMLSLRNEQGSEIARCDLPVEPGRTVTKFVNDLFSEGPTAELPSHITGLLSISSDKPFHLLGLRQRGNGILASLTAGSGSYPEAGSQIMYLVDSGIDITCRDFTQEQLTSKTVYELTGISKAAKSQKVILRNTNPEKAVTLKCYFINNQGREFLSFLIVVKCGQTLIIDPFDFEIPGTDLRTSELIFGTSENVQPMGPQRWTAAGFGSGKFLFSAGTVGLSLDEDNTAEKLYPGLLAPIGECGVNPMNTGSGEGPMPRTDLNVCNALPMAFDYLTADLPEHSEERTEVVQADARWMALTAFSRTMAPAVGISLVCQAPAVPDDPAKVFEAFEALNRQADEEEEEEGEEWPTALVIYNGAETYKLSK